MTFDEEVADTSGAERVHPEGTDIEHSADGNLGQPLDRLRRRFVIERQRAISGHHGKRSR